MAKQKTAAQQRVAIMRDVIKQIDVGGITPWSGVYLGIDYARINQGVLQKVKSPLKKCKVCALGAAFLSSVRLYNQYDGYGGGKCTISDHLTRTVPSFTQKQVDDVEAI